MQFFFHTNLQEKVFSLSEESSKHISLVLRKKINDEFYVTDGKGTKAHVKIIEITKKNCIVEIISAETIENNTEPKLHIAIAFTKNNARMEWFLEKACEMGIAEISPLITKRSEKIHLKKDRLEKILISAMLQSKQFFLPKLNEPCTVEKIMAHKRQQNFIAHCENENDKINLQQLIEKKDTLVLIGPEGDFTAEEIVFCKAHGFVPISLGKNRLRTETAGLVVCSIFNFQK
ncbi:MAG: 16S rRNA (uracil(1498)-N(3))-methyltransferase [Chitinophagaceae bacterium]|nr:16S rRNA (uracil(1498)-N(3))-methyltransferase [Chitinophagaceae bacterium]